MDKDKSHIHSNIELEFPEKKYEEYLSGFGVQSDQPLADQLVSDFFIQITKDFYSGQLKFDDFSLISNKLWWERLMTLGENKDNNKELGDILHIAGELSFYVRNTHIESTSTLLKGSLKKIQKYYKSHFKE